MIFSRPHFLIAFIALLSALNVQASSNNLAHNAGQGVVYKLDLQQVLQQVINHYPSIKSAAIQVAKAQEESIKVNSQLSWTVDGSVGFNRSTSLFGTATDRYRVEGGINRDLRNGDTLGFKGEYSRENASDTFGPNIPNPLTRTRVDVNYRHRLGQGAGNPGFKEDLNAANIGEVLARSEELALYDQLAEQVLALYLSAATTQARMTNIDKTIARSSRLKAIIKKEVKLGLSQEKDALQIDARLSMNRAEKISLQVAWKKQLISLNRLMGKPWTFMFVPALTTSDLPHNIFSDLFIQSQQHSPELKRIEARIKVAQSAIRVSREHRKDKLDLVVFLGNEFNQGELPSGAAGGDLSESEIIGGVSLEFRRGLDKSGFDAGVRQAYYDKDLALQDKKQVLENLHYNIASLLAELDASEQALAAFKLSVKAEHKKLNEATLRFRDGRIETDRIIEFESQLASAELALALQNIELIRRNKQLDLLRGETWSEILTPTFELKDKIRQQSELKTVMKLNKDPS